MIYLLKLAREIWELITLVHQKKKKINKNTVVNYFLK